MNILVELGMHCFLLVQVYLGYKSYKQVCKENMFIPKIFDSDTQHRWNNTYLMIWSIDGYEEALMS